MRSKARNSYHPIKHVVVTKTHPWDRDRQSFDVCTSLSMPNVSMDDDVYIFGYYCKIDTGINGDRRRITTILSLTGTPEIPCELDPIQDICLYPIFYHDGFVFNTHELTEMQANALDKAIVMAKEHHIIPDTISISNDFMVHPLPWSMEYSNESN